MSPLTAVLRADPRIIPALRMLRASTPAPLFLVGGCVRDTLLGRPVADVDLVLPSDALTLARAFARQVRGAFIVLDEKEGVGRVVVRRTWTFDFSPFKGRTLEDDLHGRDFTINAMAYPLADALEGVHLLIDPLGGADDLQRRRLVAVSSHAFTDDPLRMLRAFRFAAQLGLTISRATSLLIRESASLIPTVSVERIQDELAFLLSEPNVTPWIGRLWTYGLLQAIIPELTEIYPAAQRSFPLLARMDRVFATPETLPIEGMACALTRMQSQTVGGKRQWRWGVVLAALLWGGKGHPAVSSWIERIADDRLRVSTRERRMLQLLIRLPETILGLIGQPGNPDPMLYRIALEAGEDVPGVALLTWAASRPRLKRTRDIEMLLTRLLWIAERRQTLLAAPRLLTGHDVMTLLHPPPGPRVGAILAHLEEEQTFGRILSKDDALREIESLIESLVH